jgi:hypothetical protein
MNMKPGLVIEYCGHRDTRCISMGLTNAAVQPSRFFMHYSKNTFPAVSPLKLDSGPHSHGYAIFVPELGTNFDAFCTFMTKIGFPDNGTIYPAVPHAYRNHPQRRECYLACGIVDMANTAAHRYGRKPEKQSCMAVLSRIFLGAEAQIAGSR